MLTIWYGALLLNTQVPLLPFIFKHEVCVTSTPHHKVSCPFICVLSKEFIIPHHNATDKSIADHSWLGKIV